MPTRLASQPFVVLCRLLLTIAAAVLFAVGCSGAPANVTQVKTVGQTKVTVQTPATIAPNQTYDLVVTLNGANGAPIDGAAVYLEMTMSGMVMGKNQPIADALGQGRYRVRTAFSMDGPWAITVVASIGGAEVRAPFNLVVQK